MSLREMCHCGHDKLSHYKDHQAPHARITCLAMGCDCRRYVNENDPKPKPIVQRPLHHPSWCACAVCKDAEDITSNDRKTDPWLPFVDD